MTMITKTAIGALLAALVATSACASYKVNYRNKTAPSSGEVHSAKQSFFLWGLVGGDEVDLDQLCPRGVSRIASKKGPGDAILFWLTGGLYAPISVEIECSGGVAYEIETSEDGKVAVKRAGDSR
jgi:hypothetical protein